MIGAVVAVGLTLVTPRPADALVGAVEETLLSSDAVRVVADLRATGILEAAVGCTLELAGARRARLRARGTLAGRELHVDFVSDGTDLHAAFLSGTFQMETPVALAEAFVLGLTRMGLLHNVVRVAAGELPDHAAGGAREWVRTVDRELLPERPVGDRTARPVRFGIEVSGVSSGDATLFLDAKSGLPFAREQIVRFEAGEMHVTERYLVLEAPAIVAAETFGLP